MDSVENLTESFASAWKTNNHEDTLRCLIEVPSYLQNLSKKDGERALEILFNERKGILKYLQVVLHDLRKNERESFRSATKQAFITLQSIMETFQKSFEPFIVQTKDLCYHCIKSTGWFHTRKVASETLKKLIELYSQDLQLDDIVDHFNDSYTTLYTRKDGCVFYIVLGAIARHQPTTESMITNSDEIFIQLFKDFKSQCDSQKQTEEIKIYLECYNDMLKNFTPFKEEPRKTQDYVKKLFPYLSQLCKSRNIHKTVRSKVIYLISCYMNLFSSFICDQYQEWHNLFNNLLQEHDSFTHIGALRSFYKIVASQLAQHLNSEMLSYFETYFISNFQNQNLSHHKKRLLIYGFGELSIVSKKNNEIFQLIAVQTSHYSTKENEILNSDIEIVAEYLKTLSQILRYMKDISNYHLNIITELSSYFVRQFTGLNTKNKDYPINSLKRAFENISYLEDHLQNEYFNSLFREGILHSCSHTLLIDVEMIQQEASLSENLKGKPICYKDYLLLWTVLFKIDDQQLSNYFILRIFNQFVSILISFIEKLNLNVKSQENEILSSTSFSLEAENESDFWFFVNLVDLYVDIFNEIDVVLIQDLAEKLLTNFIKYSYQHPMISGFYKLVDAIFRKSDIFSECETSFDKLTLELVVQYLLDVLKIVCNFSGELQLSCVYLIFNTPSIFIKNLINESVSVFEIAFTMGLTDLPLAFFALNTLENWIKLLNFQYSADFLKTIIHQLEPYLSSKESLTDSFQGFQKFTRYDQKNSTVANGDESLEDLQNKILLFYGSLKTDILFDYVHEKAVHTNASWSKKNILQCDLLFPDIRVGMEFDALLPRVVELTRSGDLKMKIAACELLHTMVTIMLGKKLMDQCFDKPLCLALLRLGCDANDAVRSLYHPFVVQLTHYFSSRLMRESRVPQDFLDSLFKGLMEKSDTAMRDCCGLYLKEFVLWSMRQSTETDLTVVRTIIRRITNFSLYPSNEQRLAAAIAFNNLHKILKENVNVVNVYWLEFLYAFVKSLEECDASQVSDALGHVEEVIRDKSSLFLAKCGERRKPPDFTDETLNGILIWLFEQCGSTSANCRSKCMELFERLLPLVRDVELIANLCDKINAVALKNLDPEIKMITIRNAKIFLRCLEFYNWIFKKKLVPVQISSVFLNFGDGRDCFFKSLNNIVTIILQQNVRITTMSFTHSVTETEETVNLTTEVTLGILNLLSTILAENEYNENYIPWNDDLYNFIICCIIYPSTVELTAKKLQISTNLSTILENLLVLMKQKLSQTQLLAFQSIFLEKAESQLTRFMNISSIVKNQENSFILKLFVKGLQITRKSKIFDFEKEFNITSKTLKKQLNHIFDALQFKIMEKEACKKLDEHVLDYLKVLIRFLLDECQRDAIEILIKLILNDFPLLTPNGSSTSHGVYFLQSFKEPIFECLLRNIPEMIKIIDGFLDAHTDRIFYLTEEMLTFVQHHNTAEYEILADEVIRRFKLFSNHVNNIKKRETIFFNIYKKAVALKKHPIAAMQVDGSSNDFYDWIIQEVFTGKDFETKMAFLKNFLVCLTNEESDHQKELVLAISLLGSDISSTVSSDDHSKFQAASYYKVLLKMLVATKSLSVYEGTMKYAVKFHGILSRENAKESINLYLKSVSDTNASKSLQLAYDLFIRLNDDKEQLFILRHFLLPSLESSSSSVIKQFYDAKSIEMLKHVRKDMKMCPIVDEDRRKMITIQIGCYNMFELIFPKIEVEFGICDDPLQGPPKKLSQLLMYQILQLRSFTPKDPAEKELTRLLHCAALNCCIGLVSLKDEEKFYSFIFKQSGEDLLWDRIVDCEKQYKFNQAPSEVRRERKQLINIKLASKRNQQDSALPDSSSYSCFRRYDLSSLTLLENVHAYDLNDMRVLSQAVQARAEPEARIGLSFENDELNAHECMSMIVGVLTHLYNSEIVALPKENSHPDPPGFLLHFRTGFSTRQDNARLFLMRVICNAKDVFLPYMQIFLEPLAEAISLHINKSPLNYVIRDILVLIIESNCQPRGPREKDEQEEVQRLICRLIERIEEPNATVTKYNLEIFENLCRMWKNHLTCPDNLTRLVINQPSIAIRVILCLLRCEIKPNLLKNNEVCKLIHSTVMNYKNNESTVLAGFEAMGWLLKDSEGSKCTELAEKLKLLLGQVENSSRERCVKCVNAIYQGCRSETKCRDLFAFARAGQLTDPEYKARCLELFLQRIPNIDTLDLIVQLSLMNVKSILRDRILGCETPVLKIVARLVPCLSEKDLKPYLEHVVEGFTGPRQCLLEHRQLAYELLAEAGARFTPPQAIGELCRRALALALTEPTDEIRQLALRFWRERADLPDTCCDRLLALFRHYTPEQRDEFASFLSILVLELTSKSLDDKRVMFTPLADCNYREYELMVPHRRRNLGSMAPLFAPSLASQASRFSMINTQAGTFVGSLRLVATKDSSFGPSAEFAMPQDPSSQTRKICDPYQVQLSKRLVTQAVTPSSSYVEYQQAAVYKRSVYNEKIRKEIEIRRNTAKTYRKYRIGDFPDVEITHATFVETLKQFIMRDWLACKNFLVNFIYKLMSHLKNSDKYKNFLNKISDFFVRVLDQIDERNNFAPVALEVICLTKEIKVKASTIGKVNRAMGLSALGIVLLEEESILDGDERQEEGDQPLSKRQRLNPLNKDTWIHLASLYKSMGMMDAVASIFKQPDLFDEKIKEAVLAQLERNWSKSSKAYQAAYELTSGVEQEHCLIGELESLAELSSWSKINDRTKSLLDGDYDKVWNDSRRGQLLPWIFEAQLQAALSNFSADQDPDNADFLVHYDNWIHERELETKRAHGEEIAMFLLCGGASAEAKANHALGCCLEQVRENWMHLSPLAECQRFSTLLKLRAMANINEYINVIKAPNLEEAVEDLVKYWDQNSPSLTDDLLPWQKLVYYRLSFVKLLHEKLSFYEDSNIQNNIIIAGIKERLNISDLAICEKNVTVLNEHLSQTSVIFDQLDAVEYPEIDHDFMLKAAMYKLLKSETVTNPKKKSGYYLASWEVAQNLTNEATVEHSTMIGIKLHLFDLALALVESAEKDPTLVQIMSNNDFVCNTLNIRESEEFFVNLSKYGFMCLKDACKIKSEKGAGDSFAKFAKYCYNMRYKYNSEDQKSMNKYFIEYTLKGMIEGSPEAAHYFPCLLKEEFYQDNEETKQLFITNCENVPSWLFLTWQAQIMSYVSHPSLSDLLIPIVQRLVDDYPNGIRFTFKQVYDSDSKLSRNPAIRKMYKSLFADTRFETFIEAMHLVCQPEFFLKHHLIKLLHSTNLNSSEAFDAFLDKVFYTNQNKSLQGSLYKLLKDYKNEVEELKINRDCDQREKLNKLLLRLDVGLKKRLDNIRSLALQLRDYSPYLNRFSGDDFDIELPNQYDGTKKPMPQYHIKIAKFDPFVQVMNSKCSPIKLTMIGNNAKKYGYLVKFGEDLRQDQRLQQAFKTVNKTLGNDTNCRKRYLSVNTYNVVPLSTSLGLIEWVDGTKSLKEFVEFSMSDKENIEKAFITYQNWIMRAGKSNRLSERYKEALVKYSSDAVIKQMKELISQLDQDYFRQTFITLSDSFECFVTLRHNFITSYAVMCVAHWLTGVGDRHPENMLIEIRTGKCYGIDFGAAFGAGVGQSVPELVPFRLTNQILGLLRPFNETALFGITMTHVLTTLRKEQGPMVACLDVFVHEPIDCVKREFTNVLDVSQDNKKDWKSSPQIKINSVRKKLSGIKPSSIMIEELSHALSNDESQNLVLLKYIKIVSGEVYTDSIRSKLKGDFLSPEEQVQCLLEQAKDLNLLGRMYVGWMPFL